jgi:hypothetical protein
MLPRMNKPPSPFNPHRIARLIAWLQAMLAWAASVLFTDVAQSRRRIRQRYGFLSLDPLARLVRDLAIVRAADLMHLRARPRFRGVRNAAAHGFRRCTTRGAWRRAIAGSRLRNALKHRDPLQRIQRLLAAIADIDAFARRYLAPRARRRLTRLFPLLVFAPPAAPLIALAAPEPYAANTS